jgi:MFS family permease
MNNTSNTLPAQPVAVGAPAAPADAGAPLSAWYALGVLTLVTLFSFVDRGVLILQAEVIRKAFNLTDVQLGFLQGTGVAIFAALAAYPMAWLADRFDRRAVLAGSVLFWSLAVIGSGLAQTYEQLVLASALVGAGEAGLVPIVYALIPDLFPEKRRQTANSIYALASSVTGGLAIALTGQVVGSVDLVRADLPTLLQAVDSWRLAMFAVAAPAPIMVMLIATIVIRRRERAADAAVAAAPVAPAAPAQPFLPYFKRHWPAFSCFFVGMGLVAFGMAAVGTWIAVIYQRVFHQTPQQLGAALGGISVVATAIGFGLSIWVVRRFGPTMGPRLNMRVLVLSALVLAGSFAAMVFATRVEHMYAIQAFYITLVTTATMLIPTIVQTLAPGHLRARVASIQGVIGSAAAAAAPVVTGLVSDQLKHLPNGLILSSALIAVPCLSSAALLFFLGERRYEATAHEARRIDEEASR